MKYCKKCKHIHNDTESLCINCKKSLLEITDENTPVYLISADGFELKRIKAALEDCGIPTDSVAKDPKISAEAVTGFDNAESDILVPFSAYEKAYDVCIGIGAIKEDGEEIIEGEVDIPTNSGDKSLDEQFEEMSGAKRTTVRVVSAFLLLLVFAVVIFGTDFIMQFIKNLFM